MKKINILSIVGVSVLLTVSGARADNYFYVDSTGSWNQPNSWSKSIGGSPVEDIPTSTDNVSINSAVEVTTNVPVQISQIMVGNNSYAAKLTITDNLSASGKFDIGKDADRTYTGYGTVEQTGGTVNITNDTGFTLYGGNNGVNSYTMTGGVLRAMDDGWNGKPIKLFAYADQSAPTFAVSSGTVFASNLNISAGEFIIGEGALVMGKGDMAFGGTNQPQRPGGTLVMAGGTLQGVRSVIPDDITNKGTLGIKIEQNAVNKALAKITGHGTVLVNGNNAMNGLGVTADGGTLIYTGVDDQGTHTRTYQATAGGWFAQNKGLLKLDWKANNNSNLTNNGSKISWGLWTQTNITTSITLNGTDNVHALLLTVGANSTAADLDISFAAADIGILGGVTLGDITNSDGASFLNYYNVAVIGDGALNLSNVQIVLDADADSKVTGLYYLATDSSAWALLDTSISSDRVLTANFDALGTDPHGAGFYALGFVIPEPSPVFLILLGGVILALVIRRRLVNGGSENSPK
ncbi:MAG: PEP-CTERM sorting domain-containing protein [Verrucomicrobiales bacterium]|nr:PEP-CTERM sorting domain-containing protein [Verrucomicrobiales bacterium]